ncbi:MAG: DNA-primase RepB domain-containing protein [Bryobacteraceae bacterium]
MSMTGLDAAVRMLDLCEGVGTDRYYVTKTDLLENKTRAWPTTAERLHQTLPAVLRAAAVRKPCRLAEGQIIMAGENVIIRPMSRTSEFIQLDDLSAGALERVQPMAFLTLATSPGNHQVWIAVTDLSQTPKDQVKDFVRRVKKGVGDKSASGAVRLAGTENFKAKYYPDFPRVAIVEGVPGRIVTTEQLESLGLVAAPDPVAAAPAKESRTDSFRLSRRGRPETWPSYQRCLDRAPLARHHKGPDRSTADFVWCMTAIDWNFSVEATADRLMEESTRARERGKDYALVTARNAATAVEKKRGGEGQRRA